MVAQVVAMVSRKALLAAVSAEENDPFVSLIGQHVSVFHRLE